MAAIGGVTICLLLLLTPFLVGADVFCDNVKAVAGILSKNASASPVHFASATYGQAPDAVYALALCGGDILDGSTCGACITSWFDKALNLTAQCARVDSNYRDCIIAYGGAGSNILGAPSNATGGSGDNTPPFENWSARNVSGGDVPLIANLTRELLVATAEKAADMAPSRYATGVMDMERVTAYPRVYSQARCTPDLPADECSACLRRLLGMVNSTMILRMGGQMGVTRCYFRYEAYQFYFGQPLLSLPSTPAPTLTKRRRSMLWVIPVVAVPLMAAAFLLFICYSRRLKRKRKGSWRQRHGENSEFSLFDFEQLLEATNKFSRKHTWTRWLWDCLQGPASRRVGDSGQETCFAFRTGFHRVSK